MVITSFRALKSSISGGWDGCLVRSQLQPQPNLLSPLSLQLCPPQVLTRQKNHLCGPEIHNRLSKCERSVIHNKLSLICVDQFKMTLFERNADLTNGVVRQVSGEIFAHSWPLSILASKLFSSYSSICAVKYIQNFFSPVLDVSDQERGWW